MQHWRERARRRSNRPAAWLVPLMIVVAAGAAYFLVQPPKPERRISGGFGVCRSATEPTCVVDGDTIRYRGEKIRIADIDAPEIASPRCAQEAALGQRAKQRLVSLINAGPFEIVASGWRDTDQYGRKLRVLRRNGRSLGGTLIAEGLAQPYGPGGRRSWCG